MASAPEPTPQTPVRRPANVHVPPATPTSPLRLPVTVLRGVGPERAAQLARLDLHTVEDLLLHQPRRYEDRRRLVRIADLQLKQPATVRGVVVACGVKRWRRGRRTMFECILDDGSARLHCRWWQAYPWMEEHYAPGREFIVFGRPESLRPRTMDHPETEPIEPGEEEFIHVNRIVPVHPLTEGLTARVMRSLVWRALEQFGARIDEPPHPLPDTPPVGETLASRPWPTRAQAIRWLHFPETLEDAELARQRLALDELVELMAQIQRRRRAFETKARALPCGGDRNRLIRPFLKQLGFSLTAAQTRVLREIRADLSGRLPMRRLLQGDVGSGKTLVAACASLMTLESGYNVALMAPTEILAEQHYNNFRRWFEPLGVRVLLRTGSRKTCPDADGPEAAALPGLTETVSRAPTMFIGTHALLTEGFELPELGLVIIDEQHRFGVAQRERLVRKGRYPHLLVMTATPIPRTLALTLYGDLDVSVIDELPPGRAPIKTLVRTSDTLPKVHEFIRARLAEGRQAYVVYPRVEETADGLKAVTREFERLQKAFAPYRVGLLHGRLSTREKDRVMEAFRANALQVLLATALVEVGVDVPNATVMLIENAEAFGLAQLHQLRGRIGRGAHPSWCILVSDAAKPEARERLRVLEETSDGFRIAEADLQLRGPGELLGQAQSGMPRLRFADLTRDLTLVRLAREVAARVVGRDFP
ncbi:MAG: ATP-dependent DNA helicase RecG [Verrucomicrobiae bacterium]|nr:ATP-dependent DNA helicase RecG [Verrucomicrobiae bacterium]